MNETENQIHLRRAKENLASCRNAENEARKALASAVESTKRAKGNMDELFLAEERAECTRRKSDYRHATN